MDILSKTKDFFTERSINNCRVGVAFSGGADSSALLLLLSEIAPLFNLEICAVHVNCNLRAEESANDEIFVRKLSLKYKIPLFVKNADLSELRSRIEECARNERYGFFAKLQKEENIKFIATAHNANDQAETLLFRLARKTGILGAGGISPFREDGIIRPLLNSDRREILSYLKQKKQPFCTDKTNSDTKFSRNRIRANIIPELEKINPNAVANIAQFCDFARKISETQAKRKTSELSAFFTAKEESIENIREKCYENGLILSDSHCKSIENCKNNTGASLLLPNFTMFVLKNAVYFTKSGEKSVSVKERQINENEKILYIDNFWKIEITDKMPQKGENYAVVQRSDFPLQIKKLPSESRLKNDLKPVNERMKKAGLSKFERENSPAVFSSNAELLAAAEVSWNFKGDGEGFRWLKVRQEV